MQFTTVDFYDLFLMHNPTDPLVNDDDDISPENDNDSQACLDGTQRVKYHKMIKFPTYLWLIISFRGRAFLLKQQHHRRCKRQRQSSNHNKSLDSKRLHKITF